MVEVLRVQMMGTLAVTGPTGADLTPHGRKVQALLAILVLADGAPVTRGRLSAMLWDNVPEVQARESLRQALHQLRGDLKEYGRRVERLSGRDAVRLQPEGWHVDVLSLAGDGPVQDASSVPDQHDRALLEGLDGISVELDQWLLAQRAKLEDRVRLMLEATVKSLQDRAAGADAAVAAAERLARFDPASEVAARALMLTHSGTGDLAAALRAFQRCEKALRARLDVPPSRELRALLEAIRVAGQKAGRAAEGLASPAGDPPARPRRDLGDRPPGLALRGDPVPALEEAPRLAPVLGVIPLDLRAADPAHAVLGELIAEEAIARLSASRMIRVVSRLSTSAVKSPERRVDEMGSQLGAHFIASGSYRVEGDRIRALIELADTRSQEVVWSERIEGRLADLMSPDSAFVDEVCARIADGMMIAEARKVHRAPLPTAEGFSLLLAGSALMHRPSVTEFKRSREVLEHLIERYPRAPEPRAWMAKWHVLQVTRGHISARDADPAPALEQTKRAIDGSPDCSMALAVEGFVHCHLRRDLDAAERALDGALAVNPSESLAWLFRSVVKIFRNEPEEAWNATKRAIELSPLDPLRHYYDGLGSGAALAANRLPEAIEMATRALKANGTHLPTLRQLAVAQVEAEEIEAARRTAAAILRIDPNFNLRDYVANVPKGGEAFRLRCARALRQAGIPEG